jgi:PAS domain S-box-containing protein
MVVTEPLGTSAYRALYENSPDGVMFTIPDGTILAANPAACRILGRTEAEICSLGRQAMADPTDGRWGPLVTERSRSGVAQGIARMIRGDGVAIEVEMSSLVFHDAEDAERSCTIIRDVTDRVAMEHELRRSRERLAEAEHVAEMGSWEWDISGGHVSWSDGLLAMYGVARDHFGGSVDAAEELVYPGDLKRVRGVLRQAVTERSSSFTFENRVLRTDGRVRTVRSRGEVVVDESGEPIRMVGITQDITNAKLAQEALQSTSSDLERRAIELQRIALRTTADPRPRPHKPLTPRQGEVLRLVADGLTSAEISARLFLSEATVKWHVKQILATTGSSTRAEAVARVLGGSH